MMPTLPHAAHAPEIQIIFLYFTQGTREPTFLVELIETVVAARGTYLRLKVKVVMFGDNRCRGLGNNSQKNKDICSLYII